MSVRSTGSTASCAARIALVAHHTLAVSLIKTGHPLGPTTPRGRPKQHYGYRVAHSAAVDDKPVLSDGNDPEVRNVGRLLRALAPHERPDQLMGPVEWPMILGYPERVGFRNDAFHTAIHLDHLHVGFGSESVTSNEE